MRWGNRGIPPACRQTHKNRRASYRYSRQTDPPGLRWLQSAEASVVNGRNVLQLQVPVDVRNRRHKSRLYSPFMLFHHFCQMFHFPLHFGWCWHSSFVLFHLILHYGDVKIKRKIIVFRSVSQKKHNERFQRRLSLRPPTIQGLHSLKRKALIRKTK